MRPSDNEQGINKQRPKLEQIITIVTTHSGFLFLLLLVLLNCT